jgi:hypothetical protein
MQIFVQISVIDNRGAKLLICPHITVKLFSIKFNESPFSGSQVDTSKAKMFMKIIILYPWSVYKNSGRELDKEVSIYEVIPGLIDKPCRCMGEWGVAPFIIIVGTAWR